MYYLGCLSYLVDHGLDCLEKRLEAEFKKTNDYWWLGSILEIVNPQYLNPQLEVIERYAVKVGQDFKKINLVVNTSVEIDKIRCNFNVYSLDLFKSIVYYYKHHTNQKFSVQYTPTNKVLFLMGKPDRIHRTPLLIELIQRSLKEYLLYSWYPAKPGHEIFDRVLQTVEQSPYKNVDLEEFSKLHTKLLDLPATAVTNESKTNWHYSGFPFDVDLFNKTGLSLVSETSTRPLWLTEKIWKPIANCNPFVLAGPPELAGYMRSQGYETWDSFLVYDQDEVNSYWDTDPKSSLEMTAENVEFFIKNSYANSKIAELAHCNSVLLNNQVQSDIERVFKSVDIFKKFVSLAKF